MKLGRKNPAALGNCYEHAFQLLLKHGRRGNPDVVLVHGIVTQSRPPHVRMGHAWVEQYDPAAGAWFVRDGLFPDALVPARVYYAVGRVGETRRYHYMEAMRYTHVLENYGPWDPVIAGAAHNETEDAHGAHD